MVKEQWQFVQDLIDLLQYCSDNNIVVTLGEAWRPQEMQDLYLKEGKTKVGHSKHQDRLAVDLNFFTFDMAQMLTKKKDLQIIGNFWEKLSPENRWGGNWVTFQDCPHFERNV